MARTIDPLPSQPKKIEDLVKPEYKAHTMSLEESRGYRGFNGRNYDGPKFPCGMCRHWQDAKMILKDAKGNVINDPLANRKCSLHPNAASGGDIRVHKSDSIKCSHFWMLERFHFCEKLKQGVHPKACAWRRHHGKHPECLNCGQGRRMVKWMLWVGYSIAEDDNRIMQGLVEEVK